MFNDIMQTCTYFYSITLCFSKHSTFNQMPFECIFVFCSENFLEIQFNIIKLSYVPLYILSSNTALHLICHEWEKKIPTEILQEAAAAVLEM